MKSLRICLIPVVFLGMLAMGCGGGSGGGAGGANTNFSTDISGVWIGTQPTAAGNLPVTVTIVQPVAGSVRNVARALTVEVVFQTDPTIQIFFTDLPGTKDDNVWNASVNEGALTISQTLTSATTSEGQLNVPGVEQFDGTGPLILTKDLAEE